MISPMFENALSKVFDTQLIAVLPEEILTRINSFSDIQECIDYVHTIDKWMDLGLSKINDQQSLMKGGCLHTNVSIDSIEGTMSCVDCCIVLQQHRVDCDVIAFQHSVCVVRKCVYDRYSVIRRYLESVLRVKIVTTPKKMNELIVNEIEKNKLPKTIESVLFILKNHKQSQYFKFAHSFLYNCFQIQCIPLCSHQELLRILKKYEIVCEKIKHRMKRKNMIKCDFILRKIVPKHLKFVFKKSLPKCKQRYSILWHQIMKEWDDTN